MRNWLTLLPIAAMATAARGAVIRPWSLPSPPASEAVVADLKAFMVTETGQALLARVPSLGMLKELSPACEAHRRIVGAIGFSRYFETELRTSLEIADANALAQTSYTVQRVYQSQDGEGKIRKAVQKRAEEIVADFREGRLSRDELSGAAEELAPFVPVSGLEARARAERLEKITAAALRREAAPADPQNHGARAADAEDFHTSETMWVPPAKEQLPARIARARFGALAEIGSGDDAKETVDRLREMAENTGDGGLQRAIVSGLGQQFRWHHPDDYNLHVLRALESIALESDLETVRESAVQIVMRHVHSGENLSFANHALDAVARIAIDSNDAVKRIAAALISEKMKYGYSHARYGARNYGYRREIRGRIAAIAQSAHDRAQIKVPSLLIMAARDSLDAFYDLYNRLADAARQRVADGIKHPKRLIISSVRIVLCLVIVLVTFFLPNATR